MKFLPLILFALAVQAAPPKPLRQEVTLVWDYPTNELSTNLTFRIYSATNLAEPPANWQVLTNIVGTNTRVKIPMQPAQRYFTASASNLWGESFSNVAETPPAPRNDALLRVE